MKKFKHPIPKYLSFKSEQNGIKFINGQPDNPWFIKAAGLAAGKGAIFAKNNKEAINAIAQMKYFGIAGKTYLIEECLEGEEFSAFALISGINFKILGYAQDHKRAFDGDLGPNTGGMGCSSPPKVVTNENTGEIDQKASNNAGRLPPDPPEHLTRCHPYWGKLAKIYLTFNQDIRPLPASAVPLAVGCVLLRRDYHGQYNGDRRRRSYGRGRSRRWTCRSGYRRIGDVK